MKHLLVGLFALSILVGKVSAQNNVGIGITNPTRPLHILYSATTTGVTPHPDALIVAERTGDNSYINFLTDANMASAVIFGNTLSSVHAGIFYNTGGNTYDLRFRTNGNVTRMTIDSIGRVGIGVIFPTFQLELSQNSAAKPTSSAWIVPSDARLKENVYSFDDGLSILKQINPVNYNYNGAAGLPREQAIGTIAQELKEVAPYMIKEWTKKDENGVTQTYLGVDYGPLQFILINSIKEQQNTIETQQQRLDSQQQKLDDQQRIIDQLMKRLDALEKSNK